MDSKIIQMMLSHEEKLKNIEENIFSKKDGDKILTLLDEQSSILKRLDQERVFSSKSIERNTQRLDAHQKDISEIKNTVQR